MPISPRQQRVFKFIKEYSDANGKSPKLSEIGKEFGYTSPATTHRIVTILVREGLVVRRVRWSRGLEIVGAKNETEGEPKIHCPKCSTDRPLSEFGICRARESGRNLYCKHCIRKTVYAGRAKAKQMKANRKAAQALIAVQRKPYIMAPRPEKRSPIEKVRLAIRNGCRTRTEIKYATKLPLDAVCDALAVLAFEDQSIRVERVKGEACFYPVKKAA